MTRDRAARRGEPIVVLVDVDLEDEIPEFIERRREDVRSSATALDRGDYATLRTVGHNLKGCGAAYGFDALTAIGAALEQAAKDAHPDVIRQVLGELADYVERVDVVYTVPGTGADCR